MASLSPVQAATNRQSAPTASNLTGRREGGREGGRGGGGQSLYKERVDMNTHTHTHSLISRTVVQSNGVSPLQLRAVLSAPWERRN